MNNADLSKAYAYIRERIINGNFPGNFSLKPDILCKKIGMSRTPVRDALRQLEAEGLVVILPRMGAKVRAIDADEYSAISGLRMALEVYAAGLAANIRTDADLLMPWWRRRRASLASGDFSDRPDRNELREGWSEPALESRPVRVRESARGCAYGLTANCLSNQVASSS